MGPTILFIHLNIILLQYFQFLVFSFQFSATISSIQTHPYIYIYAVKSIKVLYLSFQSFFFFSFLSQSKFLNYETTSTLRLYFSTMCCTWSTLDEIFSFIKKKTVALFFNHVLYVVYPCSLKKIVTFIVQPCVGRGSY